MMKTLLFALFLIVNIYSQSWDVIGEMPRPVYGAQAIVKDSLIYIIGGYSEQENSAIKKIQTFNPRTGEWKVSVNLLEKRHGLVAGLYGDSLIMVGGTPSNSTAANSMELWNFKSEPQDFDSQANFIRKFASGITDNGFLYVFGGTDASLIGSYFYKYDFGRKKVTSSENFIYVPLLFPFQQIISKKNDNIYLFGGATTFGVTKSIYKYNLTSENFEKISASLSVSRAAGAAVNYKDQTLIIGGYKELNEPLNTVDVFEAEGSEYKITSGPQLNYPRSELMAVNYNDAVYVFGGKDEQNQPVKYIERYGTVTTRNDEIAGLYNFDLMNNYPNPFNPSTIIRYSVPEAGPVKINIYNSLGELSTVLYDGIVSSGYHTIPFTPVNLSSGIYVYEVIYDGIAKRNKMLYLK